MLKGKELEKYKAIAKELDCDIDEIHQNGEHEFHVEDCIYHVLELPNGGWAIFMVDHM